MGELGQGKPRPEEGAAQAASGALGRRLDDAALLALNHRLSYASSLDSLTREVVLSLSLVGLCSGGVLLRYSTQRRAMRLLAAHRAAPGAPLGPLGEQELGCDAPTSVCLEALQAQRVSQAPGLRALLSLRADRAGLTELLPGGAAVALPLWIAGEPWGVLALCRASAWDAQAVERLERVAALLTPQVQRVWLSARLERARGALSSARARLCALFEDALSPVALLDALEGRVVRANARFADYIGVARDALGQLSLLDLQANAAGLSAAKTLYVALERGAHVGPVVLRRADGRLVFGTLWTQRLEPHDNPLERTDQVRILAFVQDTTEQRTAQGNAQRAYDRLTRYTAELETRNAELSLERKRALESDRLKSSFLANFSHEVRTPLNSIVGYSQRVRRSAQGRLSGREDDHLAKVLNNSALLLRMLERTMVLSRLELGGLKPRPEFFDPLGLLEECAEIGAELVEARPIEVRAEGERGLMVCADLDLVRQVMLNLLTNAAKFTEVGEIVLRVAPAALPSSVGPLRQAVALSVRDTGVGMSPAACEAIFEPFRQLDDGLARKRDGVGLGLAIVARMADLLGGRVTVRSALGKGATFVFYCPRTPVGDEGA